MSDVEYRVGKHELEALSSASEDEEEEHSSFDGDAARRRSRRLRNRNGLHGSNRENQEESINKSSDGSDPGKLDPNNIVNGKRNRTQVDYRKLNEAIFGELSDGEIQNLDGGDDFRLFRSTKQSGIGSVMSEDDSEKKVNCDEIENGSDVEDEVVADGSNMTLSLHEVNSARANNVVKKSPPPNAIGTATKPTRKKRLKRTSEKDNMATMRTKSSKNEEGDVSSPARARVSDKGDKRSSTGMSHSSVSKKSSQGKIGDKGKKIIGTNAAVAHEHISTKKGGPAAARKRAIMDPDAEGKARKCVKVCRQAESSKKKPRSVVELKNGSRTQSQARKRRVNANSGSLSHI